MDSPPPTAPLRAGAQPVVGTTGQTPARGWERRGVAVLVVALHAAGLLAMVHFGTPVTIEPEIRPIEISFIPLEAPPQPEAPPPAQEPPEQVQKPVAPKPPEQVRKPVPPKPQPVRKPPPPKAAPAKPVEPVLTRSATALASSEPEPAPAIAEPPPVTAAPVATPPAPAALPPAPVVAARFDADYLNNPAPAYPPLSRRMREEGKVMLRVLVTTDGLPGRIEVARSSGSERLDDAARNAVRRWRFVPARQGERAIEASVLVPIIFKLEGN